MVNPEDLLFQFQSGAVKRRRVFGAFGSPFLFQFQSGAVKRSQTIGLILTQFWFQFQSGAVKSALKEEI